MSTRAQIVVEGNEGVYIYQHCDGYPEGILPTLCAEVKRFVALRGFDPEYLTARIMYAIIEGQDPGNKGCTGFGLGTEQHGDIEYLYKVCPEGELATVKVYEVDDRGKLHLSDTVVFDKH